MAINFRIIGRIFVYITLWYYITIHQIFNDIQKMMHSFCCPSTVQSTGQNCRGHGKLMRHFHHSRNGLHIAQMICLWSPLTVSMLLAHPAKNQVFRSGWHATYSMWSCCQISFRCCLSTGRLPSGIKLLQLKPHWVTFPSPSSEGQMYSDPQAEPYSEVTNLSTVVYALCEVLWAPQEEYLT